MMRFALPKTLPQAASAASVTFASLRTINKDLVAAINAAYTQVHDNGPDYVKWFGTSEGTQATVIEAMTQMCDFANGHATVTLVAKDASKTGVHANAYVWPQGDRSLEGQYILNLGIGFGRVYRSKTIQLKNPDGNGQALKTIAHEMCHLVFNANICPPCPDDYKTEQYRENALQLATSSPAWAAWNADNYAYFIEACSPGRAPVQAQADATETGGTRVAISDGPQAGPEEKELKSYLQQVGLGEYAAAFRQNGVTSLKLLRMLDSDTGKDVKTKISEMIKTGWKEGDKTRSGSILGANQVDTVTADDVQAHIEKEQTSEAANNKPETDPEVAKAKQQQLQKAIDQVRDLREHWAKVAAENNESEKKKVADMLDKVVGQFRADHVLDTFPSADELAKDLTSYFSVAETALAQVSVLTTAAVRKTKLSAIDLIFGHQLLRGRYLDANGMLEAPGGAVLAMPKRSADADLFGPGLETKDFSRSYRSESSMMRSERLIETHASSFAVATEASGAAFMGSGIGAMSLSAEYSQAKEERNDTSAASSTRIATEIQTRYHWSPMRQIVFATNQFRLNSEVLAEIRSMLDLATMDRRYDVLEFMKIFGSHVFGRITFGGWYKYTAKATARDESQRSNLENAVATAMDWAVSASATYIGLGGAASASVGSKGSVTNMSVSGRELRATAGEHEVVISTTMLGGVDGLPREEWIGSVQYPAQWRVIQREAPVPIWTLVARIEPPRLAADLGDDTERLLATLASEFEEVWVQEIFAHSLNDKALAQEILDKEITRVVDLEKFLKEKNRPEAIQLVWDKPDNPPNVPFQAGGTWTGPTALVYRNALFWLSLWTSPDFKKKEIVDQIFDGTNWNAIAAFGRSLILPVVEGGKTQATKHQAVEYFGLYPQTLNWAANVEPAIAPISDNKGFRGQLLICAPHNEKSTLDWILYDPPSCLYTPYIGTGLPAGRVGPALIHFLGKLHVIYADPNSSILCGHVVDFWFPAPEAPSIQHGVKVNEKACTNSRIAAAVFNNRLYVAYRETESSKICFVSTSDGSKWDAPLTLSQDEAGAGPSLVVFSGPNGPKLYCAYLGKGEDESLYIVSTSDGSTWSVPNPIGKVRTQCSPSLVPFTDQQGTARLYCFYKSLTGTQDQIPLNYRVASWV